MAGGGAGKRPPVVGRKRHDEAYEVYRGLMSERIAEEGAK